MDIQGLAKYACCPEVFFPLRVGVLEQGIQDRAPCACCATVFFFVFFCSFICLFVCLFCPVDRAQNSCCAKKKEDLNCFSTGCLHTDDRLRAQAKEGAEDGGKGGGADGHEIMTDILGLASCDALVGTMTSQVCNV